MLWFTGSSAEGLPFIHDSFRANLKAVHHKPKQPRQTHPEKANDNSSDSASTARQLHHKDVSREAMELDSFRLPAVESMGQASGSQLSSRAIVRLENGRDPVSFTSYMRRYKACARLKGFSPTRAYCATRMKSTSLEKHHRDAEYLQPHIVPKESLSTTAIPMSNLRLDPKSDHPKADPPTSGSVAGDEAASTELPEIVPRDSSTAVTGSEEPSSVLEKQVEEKLKRGSSEDGGMKLSGLHNSKQRRGRGSERRSGGGGGGSGHVMSRGGLKGGGRPLGDIVSPRRLQELLAHQDDRTLPYTYYRTALGKEQAPLENVDTESPE